jgi:toluene monooxygenase system ferredoxin subunit
MTFRAAIEDAELWEGEVTGVTVDGVPVVLIRLGGEVHAYVDRCAHLGFPLSRGQLAHGVLTCSAHGWEFDAKTGCGRNPRAARLHPLPLRIEGDLILVDVAAAPARRATACAIS